MVSPAVISPICLLAAAASCLAMYTGARLTTSIGTKWLAVASVAFAAILGLLLGVAPHDLGISNLLVAGIGLLGGVLIGRHIASARVLAVALACAAGADCASFFFGPTHYAMRQAAGSGAEPIIAYLSISMPIHAHLYSVIGLGDLWIFTACVTATRRLGWPEGMALFAPLLGILTAVGAALICGPLPALPFLAGTVFFFMALRRPACLSRLADCDPCARDAGV